MKRLGIALSLYKRKQELLTNINIIRNHWIPDFRDSFISVCCNDPETFEELRFVKEIDCLTPGDNIPSTPKPLKRCRQWDCIKKSVSATFGKSEYTIHYHSDAFAMRAEPILEIVSKMTESGALVAFRGRGKDYKGDNNEKLKYGDSDDHYLIFNTEKCLKRKFFETNPLDHLASCNVESLLSKQVHERFSPSEILHYSDMSECEIDLSSARPDPFYKDGLMHRNMHPYNLDRGRAFFHSADQNKIREVLLEFGVPENLIAIQAPKVEKDSELDSWLNT